MESARLVRRVGKPTGLSTGGDARATARLVYVSGVATVIGLIAVGLSFFRQPNVGARAGSERPLAILYLGLAASVAMFAIARSRRIAETRRERAGLVYLVVVCALTAYFCHALPYAAADVVRGVSPVVIAIVFFAALVPVAPRRLTVAAVVAVAMDPAALALTVIQGAPSPPWNLWLWLLAPDIPGVLVAIATSRWLQRARDALREARELGSYRLVDKLGSGGMGEVWKAEHRSLSRPAAIKLIRADALSSQPGGDEQTFDRFEREAQATASLESPHSVGVYDYGIAEGGSFYLVMELLEGMDLDKLVKRHGPLPAGRVARIIEQICHSLKDAHERGVVHRDIKPANVFLCRNRGEWDFVKVLDFGLAKRVDQHETQLTGTGAILGTPTYLAPETIRGEVVDGRADLYAVGCIAYKLLSGQDVFAATNVFALLVAHVEEAPAPLPAEVPSALSAVIMRCLAKSPDDRFEGAAALAHAVRATGLSDAWTAAQAEAWWTAHEPPAASSTAGAAANHASDAPVAVAERRA